MNKVLEGTFRYVYPSRTSAEKVRLGTHPFRGVPRVPVRTLPRRYGCQKGQRDA